MSLSADSGVGITTIRQIEAGQNNPTVKTLDYLASALGVGFSDLFSTV